MSRRSIARALVILIQLLPLAFFTPKAEAAYAYTSDTTYSQMGWMDVKRVGWDFNPAELLLMVQYQANIPNSSNMSFGGTFWLDTDRNPTTGSFGFDYYVEYSYAGGGGGSYCYVYRYVSGSGWQFHKNLACPYGTSGGDTVELGVPLADIGSPTAIDVGFEGKGIAFDKIEKKYSYDPSSEDRSITVDGNPADWGSDTPDITDPTGDASPGWADATNIYTTSNSTTKKIYGRIDLAAKPLSLHPEAASSIYQYFYVYFDADRSTGTGQNIGGIGADYSLNFGATTSNTSRGAYANLYRLPSMEYVSTATLQASIDTCVEWSLLLSDIGVTTSVIDIYVEYVATINSDRIPNTGLNDAKAFTATKVSNPPPRALSEASTQILSAATKTAYFIYADPTRMISLSNPWQAGFAAYDAAASGILYGLCANEQEICYDNNATIVVGKKSAWPVASPFNYGKVLLSSKSIVVLGGPTPNWVVDYYERTGQTPLKLYRGTTDIGFQTQAGTVAYTIPKTTDFTHNDIFVVMTFQDTNGNFVLIIYGLEWRGSFAGGIYFRAVIKPNLATATASAYVFKWTDAGAKDGVPQSTEIAKVYPS